MVQEADQYRAEDEAQREKVTAKNSLESLAFNMKSTVEDEKLKDKISPEDKKIIVDKCNDVIAWLDRNQVKTLTTWQTPSGSKMHKFLFDNIVRTLISTSLFLLDSQYLFFCLFPCAFYISDGRER